jgi:hypothetical protein
MVVIFYHKLPDCDEKLMYYYKSNANAAKIKIKVNLSTNSIVVHVQIFLPERFQVRDQSVYTKSGCRSPNSILAFNFPSSSPCCLLATIYFSSSFARSPGRFFKLTLFLNVVDERNYDNKNGANESELEFGNKIWP